MSRRILMLFIDTKKEGLPPNFSKRKVRENEETVVAALVGSIPFESRRYVLKFGQPVSLLRK
ncbi:MAG: hypothetical protein ACOYCB_05370 [Fastidiosipilaceae bacterium]|nr:hypothetical protein [Clostridiaceae bacterium]